MNSSEYHLFEQRRRLSDKDRRQLSFIFIIAWLVLTIILFSLVILMDYRRFESEFHEISMRAKDLLVANMAKNEAVLEGFASYIAGLEQFDETEVAEYAKRIIRRFPHVSMLEIAEKVAASDVKSIVDSMRSQGYEEFAIKAFDYTGDRQWRALPDADYYYPLTFIYPLAPASRPVLGLDMGSHEHLELALRRALETGSYQTSLPFNLIEGDNAYVMFMPGYRSEDIIKMLTAYSKQFEPVYIILIVLRSQQLLSLLENLLTESWRLKIYHNDRPADDPAGWLVNRSLEKQSWLPVLGGEYQLDPGRKGFVMRLEKRFDLEAISLDILMLAGLFSLIVFILSRLFILRRYQRDILRSQREARLELLASYDALTQLPNRNQLLEWLQEGIAGVSPDASLAVLFIDVDEFKQVNDRYGHVAGDLVLQKIAERIKRVLRKDDLAVRLGGDEFVIVLNQITSDEQANEVVSKLSLGIEEPITIKNEQVSVRISIGVALYPDSTDDPLQLINLADQVMYQAKRARYRRF